MSFHDGLHSGLCEIVVSWLIKATILSRVVNDSADDYLQTLSNELSAKSAELVDKNRRNRQHAAVGTSDQVTNDIVIFPLLRTSTSLFVYT